MTRLLPAASLLGLLLITVAANAPPTLQEYQLRQEAERLAQGGAKSLPSVKMRLQSADPFSLRVGLYAAGELGPEAMGLVADIASFLSHPDRNVRVNAVVALGKMGPFATSRLDALIARLDDDDRGVANGAAEAIARVGNAATPQVAELLTEGHRPSGGGPLQLLSEIGQAALPVFFHHCTTATEGGAALGHRDWFSLTRYPWALREAIERSDSATPFFDRRCRDAFLSAFPVVPESRFAFIPKGLAEMRKFPPQPGASYTPVEEIWARVFILGVLGKEAGFSLGQIRAAYGYSTEPRFLELLTWAEGRISRGEPADSLGSPSYLDWVVSQHRSGNEQPGKYLLELLSQMGPDVSVLHPLAPLLDPLITAPDAARGDGCSPELVVPWARALLGMGPAACGPYTRGVERCLESLSSSDARYFLVSSLGRFGSVALPALQRLIVHPAWHVRLGAVRGLEQIADTEAQACLESFWASQGIPWPVPSITLDSVLAKRMRHEAAVPGLRRFAIPAYLLGIALVIAVFLRRRRS